MFDRTLEPTWSAARDPDRRHEPSNQGRQFGLDPRSRVSAGIITPAAHRSPPASCEGRSSTFSGRGRVVVAGRPLADPGRPAGSALPRRARDHAKSSVPASRYSSARRQRSRRGRARETSRTQPDTWPRPRSTGAVRGGTAGPGHERADLSAARRAAAPSRCVRRAVAPDPAARTPARFDCLEAERYPWYPIGS